MKVKICKNHKSHRDETRASLSCTFPTAHFFQKMVLTIGFNPQFWYLPDWLKIVGFLQGRTILPSSSNQKSDFFVRRSQSLHQNSRSDLFLDIVIRDLFVSISFLGLIDETPTQHNTTQRNTTQTNTRARVLPHKHDKLIPERDGITINSSQAKLMQIPRPRPRQDETSQVKTTNARLCSLLI
jgi:hypothetical protein